MTDDWLKHYAPTREWRENPRQWASNQVLRCGEPCSTHYLKNREEIEKKLEVYKTRGDIPILFVLDPPQGVPDEFGDGLVEIMRDPLFDMCTSCCFGLAQAHGFSDEVVFEMFFRHGIYWKNLAYN